jgi:arginine utilization protein RocB
MTSEYKECVAGVIKTYHLSDKELKKMYDSDFALRLVSMFDFNSFKKTAKESSVKLAMNSELRAMCDKKSKKTNKRNKTKKRVKRRK